MTKVYTYLEIAEENAEWLKVNPGCRYIETTTKDTKAVIRFYWCEGAKGVAIKASKNHPYDGSRAFKIYPIEKRFFIIRKIDESVLEILEIKGA